MVAAGPAEQPWKLATTTVGLVAVENRQPDREFNIMSAEWTFFVAKDPTMLAVVVHESNFTHELLQSADEFTVTLCSEGQVGLADFCGGFTGRDIDKTSSAEVRVMKSDMVSTPWVDGGIAAFECTVHIRVPLPHYTMVIGTVVASHYPDTALRPLVKSDSMYHIGPRIQRTSVTVGASVDESAISVGGVTGDAATGDYRVRLIDEDGRDIDGQTLVSPDVFGDLLYRRHMTSEERVARVIVDRDGASSGEAYVLPTCKQ